MGMAERELFSGELIEIVEFTCPAGDEAWRDLNVIESDAPLVVFPRVPVVIRHVDAQPVLATPNLVMLYNPGQLYERELRNARGDECLYMRLLPRAVAELEAERSGVRDGRLLTIHAPASRVAYLHQHLLARHLRGEAPDPLLVEEAALRIVRAVTAPAPARGGGRGATRSSHRQLAEAAKELLASTLAESIGLQELAARLRASPFHLARVFRRETGFSLHEYRTQLRLRSALERLPESAGSLSALAFEHGFASHSHFTDTFRREFGLAPSAVRDERLVRELLAAA